MGAPADGDPARSIMPNAGLPQRLEGRFIYAASAEYFGTVTPRLLAAGARIVGGCCGTTPEHIAAMRAVLDATEAPGRARSSAGTDRRRRHAGLHRDRPRSNDDLARGPLARRGRRRRRAAPDPPGRAARRRPLRRLGRDRSAAEHPHRADDRGRPAPARRRRRPRQRLRLGDGPGPDERPVRGVRDPARPRPRVPRPLHDARPEPDGARVGAARRPRARGPQHHRADRRPAADRRLPDRDRDLGHRFDRADRDADPPQPRRGPDRPLDRPARRVHHRLRARFDRRRRDDRVGSSRTQARRRARTW